MMQPRLADQITVSPEVLFQEVGGEAVLLDLKSESYFGLDDVGMRIWQLLQEQGSLRAPFLSACSPNTTWSRPAWRRTCSGTSASSPLPDW
jgi:hypothetical protein